MYGNLDKYAALANSIEPALAKEYDPDFGEYVNEPIEAGISAFSGAAEKMKYNFVALESEGNRVGKESFYGKRASHINPDHGFDSDHFDKFLSGQVAENEPEYDEEVPADVLRVCESPEMERREGESLEGWLNRCNMDVKKQEKEHYLKNKDTEVPSEMAHFESISDVVSAIHACDAHEVVKNSKKPGHDLKKILTDCVNRYVSEPSLKPIILRTLTENIVDARGDLSKIYAYYLI